MSKIKLSESQIRKIVRKSIIKERVKMSGLNFKTADKLYDEFSEDANSKFFPMSSKDINDVDSTPFSNNFRQTVQAIINKLKEKEYPAGEKFQPILGSAYRSPKEQKEKISKGYSKSKTIYGYHVALDKLGKKSALAVDLVDKRYNWGDGGGEDIKLGAEQFFKALGEICNSDEFKDKVTWGGDWDPKTFTVKGESFTRGWDPAHVQTKFVDKAKSAERTKQGLEYLKASGKTAPESSTSDNSSEDNTQNNQNKDTTQNTESTESSQK